MRSVIVTILLALTCSAATINVATTGSDITGTGSGGAPYLSVQKAINVMAAGDTILVANGTYSPNYGAEYTGTSVTPVVLAAGVPLSFTTQTGKAWSTSFEVYIRVYETSNHANYAQCGFTSYNSGTGVLVIQCASSAYFNCVSVCASVTDWTIVPGNYTFGENSSIGSQATNTIFGPCGNSGSPIVIKAANVGGAIFDGGLGAGYFSHGSAAAGDGVLAADIAFSFEGSCAYVTFQGFVFQNFFHQAMSLNGGVEDHITISQNTFQNIARYTSCITNASATCASGGTGGTFGNVGVYAGRPGGVTTSNITFDRNTFANIGRLACTPTPCTSDYSHDHGLYLYDGPYTITNNIFYGENAGWNIQFAPGSHDVNMFGNTFIGGSNPVKDGCIMLWSEVNPDSNKNFTFENNLFSSCTNFSTDSIIASGLANIVGLVWRFNTANTSAVANTAIWCVPNGTTCTWTVSSNLLSTSPTYVNAGANNYHLTNNSAGINVGTTVTDATDFDGNPRPLGGAYDMGAYEVIPTPTHRSFSASVGK